MPSQTPQARVTGWRAWKVELLGLFGSIASFGVMVVLLAVFDGRSIFDWKSVTLNAVISVLSVSMKASLTFAVAELIGQWKWILFSRSARPLMDFERIDMASRGPLGCISVLTRMENGSWPLRLGALVVVIGIAIDPFAQQLLQLQPGMHFIETPGWLGSERPDITWSTLATKYSKGKLSYADDTTESAENPGSGITSLVVTATTQLDISMKAAILNGISQSQKTVSQQQAVQCPTANCTWDPFQTLGVCHRCNNLTSELKVVGGFGPVFGAVYNSADEEVYRNISCSAFVLPNGHFLVNINGCRPGDGYCPSGNALASTKEPIPMTSFGTGDPKKTNTMQAIDTLIWSMSIINIDYKRVHYSLGSEFKWPDTTPVFATECATYYCVKTMAPSVEGNIVYDNASEARDAVRDPNSWSLGGDKYLRHLQDHHSPENIPPDNTNATLEYNPQYSVIDRSDLVLHFPENSSKGSYSITSRAVWSISQYFQELLSANITDSPNATAAMSKALPGGSVGFNGAITEAYTYNSNPGAITAIWNSDKLDIPDTFAALATSMTNTIRQIDKYNDADYVGGFKGMPYKYYHVQWEWLALHSVVLTGAVMFWFVTVRKSTTSAGIVPAWKNSSLAVISRASSGVEVLKGANLVGDMEKRARKRRVTIPLDDDGDGETLAQTEAQYGHDGDIYLAQSETVHKDRDSHGLGERETFRHERG